MSQPSTEAQRIADLVLPLDLDRVSTVPGTKALPELFCNFVSATRGREMEGRGYKSWYVYTRDQLACFIDNGWMSFEQASNTVCLTDLGVLCATAAIETLQKRR